MCRWCLKTDFFLLNVYILHFEKTLFDVVVNDCQMFLVDSTSNSAELFVVKYLIILDYFLTHIIPRIFLFIVKNNKEADLFVGDCNPIYF